MNCLQIDGVKHADRIASRKSAVVVYEKRGQVGETVGFGHLTHAYATVMGSKLEASPNRFGRTCFPGIKSNSIHKTELTRY
jgi:hypothetical protein